MLCIISRVFPQSFKLGDQCPATGSFLGTFLHCQEIGGHLLLETETFVNFGDITVPSVDSFRGHLRQKGVKMHIFVLQGKPCISNAHACLFPLNKPKTVMVKVEWVKIMFFFVFFSLSFLLPLSHKRVSVNREGNTQQDL